MTKQLVASQCDPRTHTFLVPRRLPLLMVARIYELSMTILLTTTPTVFRITVTVPLLKFHQQFLLRVAIVSEEYTGEHLSISDTIRISQLQMLGITIFAETHIECPGKLNWKNSSHMIHVTGICFVILRWKCLTQDGEHHESQGIGADAHLPQLRDQT